MVKVIFNYKGSKAGIQCNIQDKIKDIFKKFVDKSGLDISKAYLLYNGNKINNNQNLNEIINEEDKKRNIMEILVNDNKGSIKEKKMKTEIVCPKCNENILIKIDEYKISLVDCKNSHEINNILLNEIENVEKIDSSKIICDICKKNSMSDVYKNEFYRCNFCKINLCPLCKSKHIINDNDLDKNNNNNNYHNIINYNDKNYICEKHDMNLKNIANFVN